MDLSQLRVLREVADQGSISAAARALSVTPSAVSQVLAALQRGFTTPLTQRQGRTVELSDAGHALATAAVDVATAMARAEAVVEDHLQDVTTTVRVSAFHSAAVRLFPGLVAAGRHPGHPPVECVDEDVEQGAFPALTAAYDIVVAHRMSHTEPWADTRLTVVPLLREPLDVAMRADHPLASRASVRPGDLVDLSWVSTHQGFSPADMLGAIAASTGTPMRVLHRMNDFTTAAAMVSAGDLVALLPRYTAAPPVGSGVVLRPLAGVKTDRRIDLLIRPERADRRAVVAVVDSLRSIAARLVADTGSETGR